jgi:rare lipoprotein A
VSGRAIHAGLTLFVAATLFAAGCARRTTAQIPAPAKIGATETGIASWYGDPYHGRRTASGEIYDMEQLTAAHKTLPFGTWVEVNDLENGKLIEVRINDRGPFVDGRIIDLSLAAARQIEMVGPGTARVRLKVIAAPNPPTAPTSSPAVEGFAVQAGAFSNRERADSVQSSLQKNFEDTRVVQTSTVWVVLVGRELTRDAANELVGKVRDVVGEAVIVRDR